MFTQESLEGRVAIVTGSSRGIGRAIAVALARRGCNVVVAAKTSSEHPATVEAFSSVQPENAAELQVIPQNRLLIDTNQALERARSAVKLKGIRAAEYRLLHPLHDAEPLWELQFFTDTGKAVARLSVGAQTGAVELINTHVKET